MSDDRDKSKLIDNIIKLRLTKCTQFGFDTNLQTINTLQYIIVICSVIYYQLDDNLISDRDYDEISKLLVKLQAECPEAKQSELWYVFHDFDGTTGFDLYDMLSEGHQQKLGYMATWIKEHCHDDDDE